MTAVDVGALDDADVDVVMPIWYPTASTRRLTRRGGGTWALDGPVHAREVGESRTACGLVANQWPMLFYRQFDAGHATACGTCAALVVVDARG